jgi:hypothetical protein
LPAVDPDRTIPGSPAACRAFSAYRIPPPMPILRMTDLDLAGKRVLIRQGEPAR